MTNLKEIVIACYNEHKANVDEWTYGQPQQAYFDLDGLKIIYTNGEWHYKPISEDKIIWW